MSEQDKLSQEAHRLVFESEILPDYRVDEKTSHERPRAIILAGQPGSGKGGLADDAKAELNKDAVTIDPDALRRYHPEVGDFRQESPYSWSGRTHVDAGQWADELLEATTSGKKNLIFDTTLSNGEWASDTLIKGLQEKGYQVEVRAVATSKLESELGVDTRFSDSLKQFGYGRHVPEGARDAIYDKLPVSLDTIRERTGVPIRLFNREGAELYDSRTDARLPSVALREAREARLQDPAITRNLRDGWRGQQKWHGELPESIRENPRIDEQTRDRLLAERASEGVVERVDRAAKEAVDVDYTARVRPIRIDAASKLGVIGLALDAYDGVDTARTVGRLRSEGNNTAADSQLVHFGSRTVGGWAGAGIGMVMGAAAGVESGPGLLLTGAAGGVAGAFLGEKFAAHLDNKKIYNQRDASGGMWNFDPEQPDRGWRRSAQLDHTDDGIKNAHTGTLRASPAMANELNYKATNKSAELILGSPPPQRDPFSQPASQRDTPSSRISNWERDPQSREWTRTVYGPFVERGMTPTSVEAATPERAAQLDQAAAQTVLANAANSPASIAAKYEDAYIQNGWARHGPLPPTVLGARTNIDKLVASDENRYQRQADGRWVSEGNIYNSIASGRLYEELEATRAVLEARLPAPREIPVVPPMTADEQRRDQVAGAYLNAGVVADPARIAAAAEAVRATGQRNGLDSGTTVIGLGRDASGRYSADSPINSLRLEPDGRTYRIDATTGIDEIRAAERAQEQAPTPQPLSAPSEASRGARSQGAGSPDLTTEPREAAPTRTALLADSPAHPDFATYQRIHQWISGTGQWDEEKSRNVASALYKEQLADPLVQRVDKVAGALGRGGEQSVFAVYAPHGDKGPFFHANVDGREAALQPAQQNLEQAEQVRQQLAQQQQVDRQQRQQLAQAGPSMSMG